MLDLLFSSIQSNERQSSLYGLLPNMSFELRDMKGGMDA